MTRLSLCPRIDEEALAALTAGDAVEIDGELLTLRDASARRLCEALDRGEAPPAELTGRLLYAVGPSPPQPGQIVGSAGPTTTERFSSHLPRLFTQGVRGIIGKGELHGDIVQAFVRHRAVYFAAIGGLGALLGRHVTAAETIAYPDLGTEAIQRFVVERFPAVVVIDQAGRNLHETARDAWRR
jgi:fumarate hydratase subunit beta